MFSLGIKQAIYVYAEDRDEPWIDLIYEQGATSTFSSEIRRRLAEG